MADIVLSGTEIVVLIIAQKGKTKLKDIQDEVNGMKDSPIQGVYRLKSHISVIVDARKRLIELGYMTKSGVTSTGKTIIDKMIAQDDNLCNWLRGVN